MASHVVAEEGTSAGGSEARTTQCAEIPAVADLRSGNQPIAAHRLARVGVESPAIRTALECPAREAIHLAGSASKVLSVAVFVVVTDGVAESVAAARATRDIQAVALAVAGKGPSRVPTDALAGGAAENRLRRRPPALRAPCCRTPCTR